MVTVSGSAPLAMPSIPSMNVLVPRGDMRPSRAQGLEDRGPPAAPPADAPMGPCMGKRLTQAT
jgi:hypothetical protein